MAFRLSAIFAAIMATQAALGLLLPGQYRDTAWIRSTWFGNDAVTLLVGVPLLVTALVLDRRGAVLGRLLRLGALAFGVYNYAFYLLGAALNVFFPLYVLAVLLAAVALAFTVMDTDVARAPDWFHPATPVRRIGGYLVAVACGLAAVWLGFWAAYAFLGRPAPGGPEVFRLVAALDLTLMVPALAAGGVLLWRRRAWGYVLAAIAGLQASVYLLILSVNAALALRSGATEGAGELPLWGTLTVGTTAATAALLVNVRSARPAPDVRS
jgi:hypothetical protein